MALPVAFDLDRNVALLGEQSMVFHCHHYNCALQKAIEDGLGDGAGVVLADSAVATVRDQLNALDGDTPEARLSLAATVYAELGFGRIELSSLSESGGRVIVENPHYSMGWLAKYGSRTEPCDHFTRGFIAGAFEAAFGKPVATTGITQDACLTMGAMRNEFSVEVG